MRTSKGIFSPMFGQPKRQQQILKSNTVTMFIRQSSCALSLGMELYQLFKYNTWKKKKNKKQNWTGWSLKVTFQIHSFSNFFVRFYRFLVFYFTLIPSFVFSFNNIFSRVNLIQFWKYKMFLIKAINTNKKWVDAGSRFELCLQRS